jgi:hypothetical protein
MIGPDALTVIIASFCTFSNPKLPRDYKIDCMEHMYNCSIKGQTDGKEIPEKKVDRCKTDWASK